MKRKTFLVISGHDYRTRRKANMHFITDELAQRGDVRFFSIGFSPLSDLRGRDPRTGQGIEVNVVQSHQQVQCYLWRTPIHPFNLASVGLGILSKALFEAYRRSVPDIFKQWVTDADTIIVESGLGVLILPNLRRWNPTATVIYIASDDIKTINCDPYLSRVLKENASVLNGARVPSRLLAGAIPPGPLTFFVPHGIDRRLAEFGEPNPYRAPINAVAVGSMLFDTSFFHIAAEEFPTVTFHAIGSGKPKSAFPASVEVYPEMEHRRTIPFIKHADIGIAPYRMAKLPYYLGDTSMKLIQYGFFGLPAVCPDFSVGSNSDRRFGYEPGNRVSILAALERALATPRVQADSYLSWADVTDRLLNPTIYPDTAIQQPAANGASVRHPGDY
jgi:2-beta-glucuronyltransferase